MASTNSLKHDSELTKLLTRYATYSTIDRGFNLSQDDRVAELTKSAGKIKACVQTEDLTESFDVQIEIRNQRHLKAHCTCCSDQDLEESWCEHVVATVWQSKSSELVDWEPFLNQSESAMQNASADDLAQAVAEAIESSRLPNDNIHNEISFSLGLDIVAPYLALRLIFEDSNAIDAGSLEPLHNSKRELNHILAEILETYGSWDDEHLYWLLEDSQAIHRLLGLLPEYNQITWLASARPVILASSEARAQVRLEWIDQTAELKLDWFTVDSNKAILQPQIIGNLSHWLIANDEFFPVARSSNSLAKFFDAAQSIRLPRYRCAAILERIADTAFSNFVVIKNPEKTPKTEKHNPTIIVEFDDLENSERDQLNPGQVSIDATIKFEYPSSPTNQDIVYLPDRKAEEGCLNQLLQMGFNIVTSNRVNVQSDAALEILHNGVKAFPDNWQIKGLEEIKTRFKFSELKIKLDLTKPDSKNGKAPARIDWFSCNLELHQNSSRLSLAKLFRARPSRNDSWILLDDGSFARIPGGSLARLRTSLSALLPEHSYESKVTGNISAAQALGLLGLEDGQISIKAHKSLVDVYEKLRNFSKIPEIDCPAAFKGKLRDYQNDGLRWIDFLRSNGLNGILADEMGLGKTIQTLAFLTHLVNTRAKSKTSKAKPALVVCPTSVTTNWLLEAKKFAPKLSVLLLQGKDRKVNFTSIAKHDLVITSYALLRIDRPQLEKFDFSFVILDEAQNIKNPSAAVTQAAKSIKSDHRLALTGTPTENRPLELWSIFDFLMPGYLGSYEYFKNYIEKPILEGGTDTQATRFLNSKTKPFVLRREKAEVEKQLPPKIESVIYVPMADSQKQLYGSVLNEIKPKIFAEVGKRGVKGASVSILAALMRLRQICNHPNSIGGFESDPGYESGKYDALQELITEGLDSNRKIIVFCQFIEMLSIIRGWIESQDLPYLYLDGSTRNRQDVVDNFNQDENVRLLLMSLKAGGTGLNLTAADTVIIYDPWWNPAVESQAIDRAHRIGQRKSVNVYRLVTENSIEEKIMQLKEKKAQIVDVLINKNGLSGLNLTKSDLESFFSTDLDISPDGPEALPRL
jgi:SNF2 family DNA or RNA helicase